MSPYEVSFCFFIIAIHVPETFNLRLKFRHSFNNLVVPQDETLSKIYTCVELKWSKRDNRSDTFALLF